MTRWGSHFPLRALGTLVLGSARHRCALPPPALTAWCAARCPPSAAAQRRGQPGRRPSSPARPRLRTERVQAAGTQSETKFSLFRLVAGIGGAGHGCPWARQSADHPQSPCAHTWHPVCWTAESHRSPHKIPTEIPDGSQRPPPVHPTCGVHAPPDDRPDYVDQPRELPLQHPQLPQVRPCRQVKEGRMGAGWRRRGSEGGSKGKRQQRLPRPCARIPAHCAVRCSLWAHEPRGRPSLSFPLKLHAGQSRTKQGGQSRAGQAAHPPPPPALPRRTHSQERRRRCLSAKKIKTQTGAKQRTRRRRLPRRAVGRDQGVHEPRKVVCCGGVLEAAEVGQRIQLVLRAVRGRGLSLASGRKRSTDCGERDRGRGRAASPAGPAGSVGAGGMSLANGRKQSAECGERQGQR